MKTTVPRTLMIAAAAVLAGEAAAAPACPDPCEVEQPDGAKILVFLRGDEYRHWTEDAHGYTVMRERPGAFWVYAVPDGSGALKAGAAIAGRFDPAGLGVPKHLRPAGDPGERGRPRAGPAPEAAVKRSGRMKNLVLLVEFPDLPHLFTRSAIRALFNKKGYRANGAEGSVRDYYSEVSYGRLEVDSVVTGWITLDRGYAYYGEDEGGEGLDLRPREMVREALAKLEASGFDFREADGDGDGQIDGLTVIHAGGGQEYAMNDSRYIWSHMWELENTVTYDGVRMRRYITSGERRGMDHVPGSLGIARIGVICHEMGHFLGLPDLYDLDFDSRGTGRFCLMGYGGWNGVSGTLPSHPSAWCKKKAGWVNPIELVEPGGYKVPRAEDRPRAYRMNGSLPASEYYLIENRQGVGFDAGLPGTQRGILIWHIDETADNNDNQRHYLVDLEEASGAQQLEKDQNNGNDADYFRDGTRRAFGPGTVPDNRGYGGQSPGFAITGISKSAPLMRFRLRVL